MVLDSYMRQAEIYICVLLGPQRLKDQLRMSS